MHHFVLVAALLCAPLVSAQLACVNPMSAAKSINYGGVQIIRRTTVSELTRNNCDFPQCTRIYRVYLDAAYTTQCNDYAMLPPHGRNQIDSVTGCQNNVFFRNLALKDWSKFPSPTDAGKQNAAKAKASVTALTEPTGRGLASDAFPLGFHYDTLTEYHSVCVEVHGVSSSQVPNRWVEIMAQSAAQDHAFCVKDWDNPGLQDNVVQEACGKGEIYTCRPSNTRKVGDPLKIQFYCREMCEQTDLDFYWRVVGSHEVSDLNSVAEKADNEDWCAYRAGDDYPTSLLNPYPENYAAPPVFQRSTSAASSVHAASFPFLVLVALLVSLLFLL